MAAIQRTLAETTVGLMTVSCWKTTGKQVINYRVKMGANQLMNQDQASQTQVERHPRNPNCNKCCQTSMAISLNRDLFYEDEMIQLRMQGTRIVRR